MRVIRLTETFCVMLSVCDHDFTIDFLLLSSVILLLGCNFVKAPSISVFYYILIAVSIFNFIFK